MNVKATQPRRRNVPIDVTIHRRLKEYAFRMEEQMHEIAEQAIVEKLDRLESSGKAARPSAATSKRAEALTA